jgi:hypothetical protein
MEHAARGGTRSWNVSDVTTTISISLQIDPEKLTGAMVGLMDRMLAQSTLSTALLRHKYAYRKAEEIPERRLRTQARSLVDGIRNSDQALELQLGYQLSSGRRIALDLLAFGNRYEDGLAAEMNGPMQLRVSHNDLARPLKTLLTHDEGSEPIIDLAEAGASALADAEEIFFRACGLLETRADDSAFEHAGMYPETGWPSPAGCSMVFHRRVAEFAGDFARIRAGYRFGAHMPAMLSPTFDPAGQSGPTAGEAIPAPNLAFYRQFSKPDADIFEFLDSLDQEEVRRLSALPEERIKSLLSAAAGHIPALELHDFKDRGLALAANPLSSVWQAYQFVQEASARSI